MLLLERRVRVEIGKWKRAKPFVRESVDALVFPFRALAFALKPIRLRVVDA